MHELPIVEAIYNKTKALAREHGFVKVEKVRVRIGALTGFVDESIDFYWKIVAVDKRCVGSELVIEREIGKIRCESCGVETSLWEPVDLCSACGSFKLRVIGGIEVEIVDIEGEHEEKNKSS